MPVLFLYLIKLSICLAAVYLFYRLLLHRLTFYYLNRWYLLGYSLLALVIPFINISPVVEENNLSTFTLVQWVPVINDLNSQNKVAFSPPGSAWNGWDFLFLSFLVGTIVMLVRFMLQWLSYLGIKRGAQLLVKGNVNIYEVDKNIIPFSIGRSVFINPKLHNQEELQEILRHEAVHVQQNHTIDIVFAEIICLFNWYNPFAWLIRHSIRENLEFIADDKALQNGVDKKQYQYLLLKVMGFQQFHFAASFNFSSLKKRIVMMNKIKSARVHLVKFLFVLPLLAVLLLAFRMTAKQDVSIFQNQRITVSGLVVQAGNYQPLSNVHFKEAISQIEGNTDEKGFYTLTVPASSYPYKTNILFTKEGYKNMEAKTEYSSKNNTAIINNAQFIGMIPEGTDDATGGSFIHSISLPGQQGTYELVAEKFEIIKQSQEERTTVLKQIAVSEKPYLIVNGHTYLIHAHGGTASLDTICDIVIVDGKKMTGKEVNEKFTRSMIHTVGATGKEDAQKKWGINQEVMEIYINSKPVRNTAPGLRMPAN